MTSRPTVKTENFDMDSLFDFSQGGTAQTSPATASSKMDAMSPFDKQEERQFNGPSHDYSQYKQQVGLPVGSMANMPMNQPQMFDGYNSGIGDMGLDGGFGNGWSSGIDMDSEMDFANPQSSMPAMFFPPNGDTDNFVNPSTIGGHEEPPSNVGRLWPGMHSQQAQQAAMQKAAQTQAMQQRQMKLQAQHAQYRQLAGQSQTSQLQQQQQQQQSQSNSKRPSHVSEPHVEESISRLLNQMRQQSSVPSMDDDDSAGGLLPQIARMKKDEEEMDEDERLLASEEGKKLSSKERRQLRNKVSARAFRSRRKEYISQLEGEVALKTQEANTLRQENGALMQENDRYRGLIETLLRHPAFTPFINDISKDPSSLMMQQPQAQPQQQMPPTQSHHQQPTPAPIQPTPQPQHQDQKPDFMNFDASQLQLPSQHPPRQEQQPQQVNLAMIPEENFSKLNLNGYQPSMNFNQFNTVNAYAVTDLPSPDPVDLLAADSPVSFPAANSTADDYSATSSCNLNVLLRKLDGAASRMAAF